MRPGKAVLFGVLGRTLFFGLPGPPYAVRTLLNELVGPAILAMQGVEGAWPKEVQAHLLHQISIKRSDVLRLKDGVLTFSEGKCLVRFAERLEIPNCFILLPPGRTHYDEGVLVEVHLVNRL
jgi:molybdopterin molybdotransferase